MMLRMLGAAVAAAGLAAANEAQAHLPAPLVPTALVEDVNGTTTDVEFMDYVGRDQVIKLGSSDVLILSYLKSCAHETITGGTVTVGAERSEVQDGKIVRGKVPCDGGKIRLSSVEASKSGASAFRVQSAEIRPVLYSLTPVVQLPRALPGDNRTLLIERTDKPGERYEVNIDADVRGGSFYDLAKIKAHLSRGANYSASIGDRKMAFRIDPKAKSGPTPVISRLLRFQ
jgi:hypothetical protein